MVHVHNGILLSHEREYSNVHILERRQHLEMSIEVRKKDRYMISTYMWNPKYDKMNLS